jgi:hypothetical protein
MPYRLCALAEQDLEEIWSYVAEDASLATDSSTPSSIIKVVHGRRDQAAAWSK